MALRVPAFRRLRWGLVPVVAAGLLAGLVLVQPDGWDAVRTFFVSPSETRFPLRGIDVSHHQGSIDWSMVKLSGQVFAFIKATEGADFRDERFEDNWRDARAEGLITGAYHFFTFCSPGLTQAENFLATAPRDAPALPLAVDVEFTGNCAGWESIDAIRAEYVIFEEHVRAHVGYTPLLYTSEDVRQALVPPEASPRGYWIRSLWGEPGDAVAWQFWQYSDSGRVPGIHGQVDLNVFAGSRAALQTMIEASRPRE